MTQATQTIPAGYKQTEIGVIPEDWEVKRLGDVCEMYSGGTPLTSIKSYYGGDIPWLTSSDLNSGFIYSVDGRITKTGLENSSAKMIDRNTLVLALYGATAGVVGFSKIEGAINQAILAIKPKKEDSLFLYFYLKYKKKWIIKTYTQGGQPNLSGEIIKSITLSFPKKPEQTAIATALSDADVLIEKLEKLITKKKAIKQGAMQQLLTGKKRLPGFSGEWDVKKLKDVSWFQEGPGVRTNQFTQSGVKLLNGTNIYKGIIDLTTTDRYISEKEAYGPYAHFMANEEDIVIASSGITIDKFEEKIAFVKKRNLPFCMNTSTIRFKVDKNLLIDRFLYYFFMTTNFKKQIGAQATGSAQLNFGPSHLEKVIIDIPIDKKEQTAITTVLSDMDAEIEKLENKLNKYRQIKTGMMQQLLTGKIRLLKN